MLKKPYLTRPTENKGHFEHPVGVSLVTIATVACWPQVVQDCYAMFLFRLLTFFLTMCGGWMESSLYGETPKPPCHNWQGRHPAWIWCDDFEVDRLRNYFEYDLRNGRFVREASGGVNGSVGMRVEYLPGDPHGGFLHLAFGKTPAPYIKPVDAGIMRYTDIYWRFEVRYQPGWVGGGGDKLTRAMVLSSDRFAQAAIGHFWSGAPPGSNAAYLYLDPASGTDEAGTLRTTTYNDFPHLRWLGALQGKTAIFDEHNIGKWVCIESHMKLNSPRQADGILEFWIDEELEASRSGLNWIGDYVAYGINAVYLENYWTSYPFKTIQQRYLDNFVVSTARIGCTVDGIRP